MRRGVTSPYKSNAIDKARVLSKLLKWLEDWRSALGNGSLPILQLQGVQRQRQGQAQGQGAPNHETEEEKWDQGEGLGEDGNVEEEVAQFRAGKGRRLIPMGNITNVDAMQRVLSNNRCYRNVILVLSFSARILKQGKTATQRELYYYYNQIFTDQREANGAIQLACAMLEEPRHALGLVASSRGYYHGRLKLRRAGSTGEFVDPHSSGTTAGLSIRHEWIAEALEVVTDARFILVIEKDGVFMRLLQDGFPDKVPCILVTGCGFPAVAVRAMVKQLMTVLSLPAYGLVDGGPYGASVLRTYKYGSRSTFEGAAYRCDINWLGLRPSQLHELSLPPTSLVPLTQRDRSCAEGLLGGAIAQALLSIRQLMMSYRSLLTFLFFSLLHVTADPNMKGNVPWMNELTYFAHQDARKAELEVLEELLPTHSAWSPQLSFSHSPMSRQS
ncbi:unnamed protein product [Chrysoparadoxa australica]